MNNRTPVPKLHIYPDHHYSAINGLARGSDGLLHFQPLHALRPVFRELGHPAAFVYEALEQSKGPQRSFDLVTITGLSRTAVDEALETLAAWHLVKPVDGRWRLVPGTSLQLLAEQFGCLEQVRTQVGRHHIERAAYRRALRIVDPHPVLATLSERSMRPRRTCGHPNRPTDDGEP